MQHSQVAAAPPPSGFPSDAVVRYDPTRKTILRSEAKDILQSVPAAQALARTDPAAAVLLFVAANRQAFRVSNPAVELRVRSIEPDELGFRHVRMAQFFHGLEVVQCELLFHFNRERALYLITGSYIATPRLETLQPKLSPALAARAAAKELKVPPADWPAKLKIWPGPGGAGLLAFEVQASIAIDQAWRIFIDANSGKILDRSSTVYTSK